MPYKIHAHQEQKVAPFQLKKTIKHAKWLTVISLLNGVLIVLAIILFIFAIVEVKNNPEIDHLSLASKYLELAVTLLAIDIPIVLGTIALSIILIKHSKNFYMFYRKRLIICSVAAMFSIPILNIFLGFYLILLLSEFNVDDNRNFKNNSINDIAKRT